MKPRWSSNAFVAAAASTCLAIILFSSTGHDDSHITLWSAWSLAEFGEILNHSGERLEQSSSLLHTLLLAALYKTTGFSLTWLAYLGGILCAWLSIARLPALSAACGRVLPRGALFVIATSPGFAYWQLGMLEGSLFTWASIEFLIRLVRLQRAHVIPKTSDWGAMLFWSGALVAVRPEAGLVALCSAGAALAIALLNRRALLRPTAIKRALAVALIVLAWMLALGIFRNLYFDQWLPQPVSAKIGGAGGFDFEKLGTGLGYILKRLSTLGGGVLLVGLAAGLLLSWRDLRQGKAYRCGPMAFVGAYLCFIIAVGGDWMIGWRFVSHIEILLVFMLFQVFAKENEENQEPAPAGARPLLIAGFSLVHVLAMLGMAGGTSTGMPLWTAWQGDRAVQAYGDENAAWPERANQVHQRDVILVDDLKLIIARLLEHQDSVSILSKQGGLVMYEIAREFYGRVEFYDRLGLVSRHFEGLASELNLPSGQMGLEWRIDDILRLGQSREDPSLRPDIIFEVELTSRQLLLDCGYSTIYRQQGSVTNEYLSGASALFDGALQQASRGIKLDSKLDMPSASIASNEAESKESTLASRSDDDELARTSSVSRSFWNSKTRAFQYIAVRSELADAAGLVGYQHSGQILGLPQVMTRHGVIWDEARKPYLRFLFGGKPQGLPQAPEQIYRVKSSIMKIAAPSNDVQQIRLRASELSEPYAVLLVESSGRKLYSKNGFEFDPNDPQGPLITLNRNLRLKQGANINVTLLSLDMRAD